MMVRLKNGIHAVLLLLIVFSLMACGSSEKKQEIGTTPEEGDNSDNTIVWLVPDSVGSLGLKGHESAINKQLKNDGYDFKVSFKMLPFDGYTEEAATVDSDIAFVGFDYMKKADRLDTKTIFSRGDYAVLDEFLNGSELERVIPESFWDGVRLDGHIYCIPNMGTQKRGIEVIFNLNKIDKSVAQSFSGNIDELSQLLPDGEKILCRTGVNEFMLHYGFQFEEWLIGDANGNLINPFRDVHYTEWNSFFDNLYREGKLTSCLEEDFAIGVLFGDPTFSAREDYYVVPISDVPVPAEMFSGATGIRANSQHKKEAFALLQLVYSTSTYANLLLFGGTDVTSTTANSSYIGRMTLGLNDFTVPMDPPILGYFATPEERLEHYSNAKVQAHFTGYDEEIFNQLLTLVSEYSGAIYPTEEEFSTVYSSYDDYERRIVGLREKLCETYGKLLK